MSLSRIQDLEVIKSEELIERLENQFNLTVPIREFKKPTESVVNKIFINILAHPGFNNELINFQLQPDSHISAVLLTVMVREALRLAEIQDPDSVICLRDIYNMQPRITVFRKIVMVLTNFALHVVETLDHLSQYETELQKQTETQEKLYNEVQDLDQKLKEDKEDLEDLKTEFSNVPMKIQNFGTEKENLTDENINMETELEKIDEELKKIKLDNKPILQRKEQLEQELKHMLSEICEDSTARGKNAFLDVFFKRFWTFFKVFFEVFCCCFRVFLLNALYSPRHDKRNRKTDRPVPRKNQKTRGRQEKRKIPNQPQRNRSRKSGELRPKFEQSETQKKRTRKVHPKHHSTRKTF